MVLVGGLLAAPASARACSCAGRATPAQAVASADVVFEGRVLATGFVVYEGQRTRLAVTRTHAGDLPARVEVTAAKVCSLGFRAGERWLVYASRDSDGGLSTSMCTRSAPLELAIDDLAFFGNARRAFGAMEAIADVSTDIDSAVVAPRRRTTAAFPVTRIASLPPSLAWLAALVERVVHGP